VDARAPRITEIESGSLEVLAVPADGGVPVKEIDVVESLEAASESHRGKARSRHFEIQTRPDVPILLHVVMIEIARHEQERTPGQKRLALGVGALAEELIHLADVHSRNESKIGVKALAAVGVIE